MTELGSPLKLDPSTSKRRKLSLILEKCVMCQKSGRETVVSFTDHSKSRFCLTPTRYFVIHWLW
jgi:hypothetical protein